MKLIDRLRSELQKSCEGEIPHHVLEKIIDEYLADPDTIFECERTDVEPEIIIDNMIGFFYMESFSPLLDHSVKKFGIPLWNEAAWQSKHCHKMCPFGDYCGRGPKKIYTIDGREYCIGQLYAGQDQRYRTQCKFNIPKLTTYELCYLTIPADKLPLSVEGQISDSEIEYSEIEKMTKNFIFEFGPFTVKFGFIKLGFIKHRYYQKTNKYPGGNVIPFL